MPDIRDRKIQQLEEKIKVLTEKLAAQDDAELSVVNDYENMYAINRGVYEGINNVKVSAKDMAIEVSLDNGDDEVSDDCEVSIVDIESGEVAINESSGYNDIHDHDGVEDCPTPKCVFSSMRAHQVDHYSQEEKE